MSLSKLFRPKWSTFHNEKHETNGMRLNFDGKQKRIKRCHWWNPKQKLNLLNPMDSSSTRVDDA